MKKSELLDFLYLETATIFEQYGFSDVVSRIYKDRNPMLQRLLYVFGDLYVRTTNLKNKEKNDNIKIIFQGIKYIDIIDELTRADRVEILIWSSVEDIILSKYKFRKVF